MERPSVVYLQEAIHINGIKIQHTHKGLLYMIDHYSTVLSRPLDKNKLKDEHRQYIQQLIDNYKIHLQLYERGNDSPETPDVVPQDITNHRREETEPIEVGQDNAG